MAGLRTLAEQDLGFIIEEDSAGPRWPITLISPQGTSYNLFGLSNDIERSVDPVTGEIITGRLVSVSLRISTLTTQAIGIPYGQPSRTAKPWTVLVDDINGVEGRFRVRNTHPDRSLGLLVCMLEPYRL